MLRRFIQKIKAENKPKEPFKGSCSKCHCLLFKGEIMCPDCLTPVKDR